MVIEVGKLAGNSIVPYSATQWDIKTLNSNVTGVSGTQTLTDLTYTLEAGKTYEIYLQGDMLVDTTDNAIAIDIKDGANSVGSVFYNLQPAGASKELKVNTFVSYTMVGTSLTFDATSLVSGDTIYGSGNQIQTYARVREVVSVDASIYVEPASETKSGLVNTSAQSFAGLKDFTEGASIKGKTDGVAVATGYVGEVIEYSGSTTCAYTILTNLLGGTAVGDGVYLVNVDLVITAPSFTGYSYSTEVNINSSFINITPTALKPTNQNASFHFSKTVTLLASSSNVILQFKNFFYNGDSNVVWKYTLVRLA